MWHINIEHYILDSYFKKIRKLRKKKIKKIRRLHAATAEYQKKSKKSDGFMPPPQNIWDKCLSKFDKPEAFCNVTLLSVDNVNPAITREQGFYLEFVVNGFSPVQKSAKGWLDGDRVMFGEEGENRNQKKASSMDTE
jgi:hypothetical protein